MTSQNPSGKSGKTAAFKKFLTEVDLSPESLASYESCLFKANVDIPDQIIAFYEKLESEDKVRLEDLGGYSGAVNLAQDKS